MFTLPFLAQLRRAGPRRRRPSAPSRSVLASPRALGESLEPRLALSTVTLTANEQLLLELINRARANPTAEVNRISGISDLNEGLPAGTISSSPKQPLAPHQSLIDAAVAHSDDMLANDYFSHTSQNGDGPSERAADAGYPYGVGENIAWGGSTGPIDQIQHVHDRHEALFKSAGHRQNLMNESYRDIGVGVRYGVFTYNNVNYNASMVTENFGRRSGVYMITGVAFTDAVTDDDFYTVGEGASGITIRATNNNSGLAYSSISGPSGGYTIEVPNGTYTVVATGNPINGQVQVDNVVVNDLNVKIDVVTSDGEPVVDPPENPTDGEPPIATNGVGLLGESKGVLWQAKSTGDGLVNVQSGTWSDSVAWSNMQATDVDGDGDHDVIARAPNGKWWVARSQTDGFVNEVWGNWSTNVSWKNVVVGDFNGDGMADIGGRAANGAWWISRSTGNAFENELWGKWSNRIDWHFVLAGDFNGDGLHDMVGRANNGAWWVGKSTGTAFENERWGSWSRSASWSNVAVGDFNGDGLDELIGRNKSTWWISQSNGSAFSNQRFVDWSSPNGWRHIRFGDFDGDGADDLLARRNGDWWVSRTHANSTVVSEVWDSWDPRVDWDDVLVVDLDRDGIDDIAARRGSVWTVAHSDGSHFNTSIWGQWPVERPWRNVIAGEFG